METTIAKLIKVTEKCLLVIIAILTLLATCEEVAEIYKKMSVQLADLLLLFIYTEVLGMIGIFFVSNKIPITLPIFIAMTAIARLIILQGKEAEPSKLLFEAGAVLLLALALAILSWASQRSPSMNSSEHSSEDANY